MGYGREFTNAAVRELLAKPAKYHTFDAFVDTLDRLTPQDELSRASLTRSSHDVLREQIKVHDFLW